MSLPVGESVEDRRRERKKHEGDIEDELRRDKRNDQLAPRLLIHLFSLGRDGLIACQRSCGGIGALSGHSSTRSE